MVKLLWHVAPIRKFVQNACVVMGMYGDCSGLHVSGENIQCECEARLPQYRVTIVEKD